jgi:hypothetical protein
VERKEEKGSTLPVMELRRPLLLPALPPIFRYVALWPAENRQKKEA